MTATEPEPTTEPITVHCLQHSERVRPLGVATWAAARGVELRVTRVDLEPLPDPAEVERLVVLGGGMNTDQVAEHPWLVAELAFLRAVLARGAARVLGICLGSQLLAQAVGGSVGRAEVAEIGWQRIRLTDAGACSPLLAGLPEAFDAFQWHGDQWTLPDTGEATLVATSDGCPAQAFTIGDRVLGLQFHPEFTHARTTELAATSTDDLTRGGFVQRPEQFLADPARFDALAEVGRTVFDRVLLDPLPA